MSSTPRSHGAPEKIKSLIAGGVISSVCGFAYFVIVAIHHPLAPRFEATRIKHA